MIYDLGIDVGTSYTAAAVRRPDGIVEVVGLGPIADNIPTVHLPGRRRHPHRRRRRQPAVGHRPRRRGPGVQAAHGRPDPHDPAQLAVLGRGAHGPHDRVRHPAGGRPGARPAPPHGRHPSRQLGPLQARAVRPGAAPGRPRTRRPGSPSRRPPPSPTPTRTRVPGGSAVAVYDLGGGTFDAAVLRKTDGDAAGSGFELLGESVGIEHLGGVDFDEADPPPRARAGRRPLADRPRRPLPARHRCCTCGGPAWRPRSCSPPSRRWRSRSSCPGSTPPSRCARREFEAMIAPRIDDSIGALEAAIASAGLAAASWTRCCWWAARPASRWSAGMLRDRFGAARGRRRRPALRRRPGRGHRRPGRRCPGCGPATAPGVARPRRPHRRPRRAGRRRAGAAVPARGRRRCRGSRAAAGRGRRCPAPAAPGAPSRPRSSRWWHRPPRRPRRPASSPPGPAAAGGADAPAPAAAGPRAAPTADAGSDRPAPTRRPARGPRRGDAGRRRRPAGAAARTRRRRRRAADPGAARTGRPPTAAGPGALRPLGRARSQPQARLLVPCSSWSCWSPARSAPSSSPAPVTTPGSGPARSTSDRPRPAAAGAAAPRCPPAPT